MTNSEIKVGDKYIRQFTSTVYFTIHTPYVVTNVVPGGVWLHDNTGQHHMITYDYLKAGFDKQKSNSVLTHMPGWF